MRKRLWLLALTLATGCAHRDPITMDSFAAPLPSEISSFKGHLQTGLTMMGSMGGPAVDTTMYSVDLPYDQTESALKPLLLQAGWKSLGKEQDGNTIRQVFMKGDIEKLEIDQEVDPDTNALEVSLVHISPDMPKPIPRTRHRFGLF